MHHSRLGADRGRPDRRRVHPEVDISGLDDFIDLTPSTPGITRPFVVDIARSQTNLNRPILLVRIVSQSDDLGGVGRARSSAEARRTIPWRRCRRLRRRGPWSRPVRGAD
jgi:hypothetical protein